MNSKRLTIFEGPDGSGKSTAAKAFAKQTQARYVHFSALPRIEHGLGRLYVEAMLPALLGYQDVVFDRSWLSEVPYGMAFREGADRLTQADRRMLERLALRCGGVVVKCLPKWEVVRKNFNSRRSQEMLKDTGQLREVYNLYLTQTSELPILGYAYDNRLLALDEIEHLRTQVHPLDVQSAGNWQGEICLVGEQFAERKDQDPWYQWPFASFSGAGCSRWLTDQLDQAGVPEQRLLWLNADQDLQVLHTQRAQIFALGGEASHALTMANLTHTSVSHPQYHKRFAAGRPYQLLDLLPPMED